MSPTSERTPASAEDPRIGRSREAIIAAATEHFLTAGYVGANVDQIAATARVSKRTVYNIYGGKERLFGELMERAAEIAETHSREIASGLAEGDDPEAELLAAAVRLARTVIHPRIIRVRRLLIGEAERFPQFAAEYYRRAPGLVMDRLADALRQFDERGVLRIDDPVAAAEHFAFLIMGPDLDRALFTADDQLPSADEVEARARTGVEVFLRAYRAE